MAQRIFPFVVALIWAAFAAASAHATSNHEYAKGEDAIIREGLAPNKQMSLASHGEGELGDADFHVWLMAEPAHRRLMALPDISSDNNLDTAPDAYHAFWSDDARHVAVAFRSSRHEVTLNLYSIEGGRARPIAGPNLFREVTSRNVADRDGLRMRISGVEWRGGNRFRLKEYLTFVVSDPALLRLLGAYGRVREKLQGDSQFIEFAAEADCLLDVRHHHYRVIDLKPGDPDHPPEW